MLQCFVSAAYNKDVVTYALEIDMLNDVRTFTEQIEVRQNFLNVSLFFSHRNLHLLGCGSNCWIDKGCCG